MKNTNKKHKVLHQSMKYTCSKLDSLRIKQELKNEVFLYMNSVYNHIKHDCIVSDAKISDKKFSKQKLEKLIGTKAFEGRFSLRLDTFKTHSFNISYKNYPYCELLHSIVFPMTVIDLKIEYHRKNSSKTEFDDEYTKDVIVDIKTIDVKKLKFGDVPLPIYVFEKDSFLSVQFSAEEFVKPKLIQTTFIKGNKWGDYVISLLNRPIEITVITSNRIKYNIIPTHLLSDKENSGGIIVENI